MKETIIYDIEIYKNLFLLVGKSVDNPTQPHKLFAISPYEDDSARLMNYLVNINAMIGFNSLRFDYPLLHMLVRYVRMRLKPQDIVKKLNELSLKIINSDNQWANMIKKPLIPQIDLYLINHYDNFAKSTSLKILEFNLKMQNIIELPYLGKTLTREEIEEVKVYCMNDVDATYEFFLHNREAIKFRKRFSILYNHKFTNYNDVKIGEYILIDAIAKHLNVDIATVKKMRTHRTEMRMDEIILPYINFQTEELDALVKWWKPRIITQTKGQFTGLDMEDVAPLLPYCNNKTVKGKLKNLNILLRNEFQIDFGTGGLHGDCGSWLFKSNDQYMIRMIDVSSYYPNLASKNGFHPAHVPQQIFKLIIDTLYAQRMKGRDEGDNQTVKVIKLALNGALYGKSNSAFSPMYDPMFMMKICVNGQLLLTMPAERMVLTGMKIIQVNTDGIFVWLKRSLSNLLDNIIDEWMQLTNLKLDQKEYNLMVQRDVNSYLAVDTSGKTKRKGAFEYNHTENGDFHKDFSMLIIPKALEAYYLHGTPVEDFIYNHPDFYDFFSRTKFDKLTKLVRREYDKEGKPTKEERLQNITRYYVSNNGDTFVKIMPPLKGMENDREFMVEAGYLCTEMNKITPESMQLMRRDLNYNYYIEQANKTIKQIQNHD